MQKELRTQWKIDERNKKDILDRIEELARGYTPEWYFDRNDPDIGSTLAILFADQMKQNIDRYNQVLIKYRTELVNMLDLSLLPSVPACAVVLFSLVQDTIPGTQLRKGTKLISAADDQGEQIVFETAHNMYVTNSRLGHIFMTDKEKGRILPIYGHFSAPDIIPQEMTEEEGEEEEVVSDFKPFRLFSENGDGIGQNVIAFQHPAVFDVENRNILVRFEGADKLVSAIEAGDFSFCYYTEEGIVPVEETSVLPDGITVCIRKHNKNKKFTLDGKEYSALILKANSAVTESWKLGKPSFASKGEPEEPEYVSCGGNECSVKEFDPFTDTLSVYAEAYIVHDEYFTKPGAHVTVSFDVSYPVHKLTLTPEQEQDELKIIKRKKKETFLLRPAEAFPEEIVIEYYNGIGWKRLVCDQEVGGLFASDRKERIFFSFICPNDWEKVSVGSSEGNSIRIRLLKAENCYMRPSNHHYPHITDMKISYTYEECYASPSVTRAIRGTRLIDLTKQLAEDREVFAFSPTDYLQDALYLGFNRKMEQGPVNMLLRIESGLRTDGLKLVFEYSSLSGFKTIKVMDHTHGLTRSGTVSFMPPDDMAQVELEGIRAYWFRVTSEDGGCGQDRRIAPRILGIDMNAMEAYNIDTRPEKDFYIDMITPNLELSIGVSDIYDAEVWVNETGMNTPEELQLLKEQAPEDVRVIHNVYGESESVYVRWYECEQLIGGDIRRTYTLDRMTGQVIFGDGVSSNIPKVTNDVAVKITPRCCKGVRGNIPAGAITGSMVSLSYIDTIENPMEAFGGYNIETLDNALMRGANLLSTRKRAVSVKDFERGIKLYCENIERVKCVVGRTLDNEPKDGVMNFVILMKDYRLGSFSFNNMLPSLRTFISSCSEMTLSDSQVNIVEPVFVNLSVDVWMEISDMDDGFDVSSRVEECLTAFLNPIFSENGHGWDIGVLPNSSQISMELNAAKLGLKIRRTSVTAVYTDRDGRHETDLESIRLTPYMICTNGEHRVHFIVK